jgi:hypothetical protein
VRYYLLREFGKVLGEWIREGRFEVKGLVVLEHEVVGVNIPAGEEQVEGEDGFVEDKFWYYCPASVSAVFFLVNLGI